ncbi:polysaccharide biosynthesis protein [Planococcus antarcticus DSM 14505]|uniref:Polysaccharide biosynthesis protein n=1 Tax=Planococcus antarcticus DSM 14505 TaxID=1185653 RepID=A0AA87IIW7_9BACL|nr:oligosaccharide flippase family protein [Planococcus antarcticus]EIM05718.1 polysaccharide biosynthesis protein [Planococcus antarcticus DSM 14505]
MNKKLKILIQKKFVKNIIVLASGTIIAQIITLTFMPIITRLYGPQIYGLMGIYLSILSFIIPVAALTYPTAIVLPPKTNKAINIIKASLSAATFLSIITLGILLIFYNDLAKIFNLESVTNTLFLIPLVILTASVDQVLKQWLIRENQFKVLSKITIYETFIVYGGMVLIGLFFPLATVLIIFVAAKSAVSSLMIVLSLLKNKDEFFKLIINHKENFRNTYQEYSDFPLYRAPQELFNAGSQSLPILMLAALFGPAAAGFYSIGRTALSIPSRLIGSAVNDVFYPRIAQAANADENITELIKRATIILFLIAIVPFGIIMIIGPWLFSLLFGAEWFVAGEYARWLSIWIIFSFATGPSIKALPVLSAQSFHLKYTIFSLVLRILALLTGFYLFESDIVAVAIFSITGALLEIILILITLRISSHYQISKGKELF